MGAGDLEVLDILYVDGSEDDEPRLKVGDQTSAAGVGQDCIYLANDGFVSMPNAPDANGAATCIASTLGNDRVVLACADNRYNAKAGALAPGDRAIVSNCDAAMKLSKAANQIQLVAAAQGLQVTVDAAHQQIIASSPSGSFEIGPASIQASWSPGGGIAASLALASDGITLLFTGPGGASSVVLSDLSGGTVAITCAPGQFTVNGVPVTVP